MLGSNYSDYTLVDATPDYMFNAMAAPRMKEMVPQAKFVVLLRVRHQGFNCIVSVFKPPSAYTLKCLKVSV